MAACSQQDGEQGTVTATMGKRPQVVVEHCGRCHVPPLPSAHPAAEWPAVVTRMQERMRAKGLPRIPSLQLEQILDYLQGYDPVTE